MKSKTKQLVIAVAVLWSSPVAFGAEKANGVADSAVAVQEEKPERGEVAKRPDRGPRSEARQNRRRRGGDHQTPAEENVKRRRGDRRAPQADGRRANPRRESGQLREPRRRSARNEEAIRQHRSSQRRGQQVQGRRNGNEDHRGWVSQRNVKRNGGRDGGMNRGRTGRRGPAMSRRNAPGSQRQGFHRSNRPQRGPGSGSDRRMTSGRGQRFVPPTFGSQGRDQGRRPQFQGRSRWAQGPAFGPRRNHGGSRRQNIRNGRPQPNRQDGERRSDRRGGWRPSLRGDLGLSSGTLAA